LHGLELLESVLLDAVSHWDRFAGRGKGRGG
jgi:hypothetical protein